MKVLIGLGNCGNKYARNRHNIGFMAADKIGELYGFEGWREKFQSLIAEGRIDGEKCLLVKPQTYMNNSGHAAQEIVQFFKVDLEDVFVLHDEIDIAAGKIKVKSGGGNAGHNGLRSISAQVGNDYNRVRLGVGRPADKSKVAGYVLRDFSRGDEEWLTELLDNVARQIALLLDGRNSDFIASASVDTKTGDYDGQAPETPKIDGTSDQNAAPRAQKNLERGPSALGAALSNWIKGNKS